MLATLASGILAAKTLRHTQIKYKKHQQRKNRTQIKESNAN